MTLLIWFLARDNICQNYEPSYVLTCVGVFSRLIETQQNVDWNVPFRCNFVHPEETYKTLCSKTSHVAKHKNAKKQDTRPRPTFYFYLNSDETRGPFAYRLSIIGPDHHQRLIKELLFSLLLYEAHLRLKDHDFFIHRSSKTYRVQNVQRGRKIYSCT